MQKITLGSRPKTFASKVVVPMHEGVDGVITVQYHYRTRTEFGAFVDELLQAARVPAPQPQPGQPAEAAEEALMQSVRQAMEQTRDANADYLMKAIAGWDIPDTPFTRENVVQLCNELPGAALAVIERYRAASTQGRLGN